MFVKAFIICAYRFCVYVYIKRSKDESNYQSVKNYSNSMNEIFLI